MRVATLEESLAHIDIVVSSSSSDAENDDDNNSQSNELSHKSVTFTDVEVREYPICLGDNPSVLIGAPLTIAWEAQSEGKLSIDDYETSRPDRRCSEELRIPSFVREEMLRNNGYSRMDIQRGVKDVNVARNRRKRTNETHRLHRAQEVAERLVRGTLNATIRRNKKKQERELIDHFRTEASALQQQGIAVRRSTWHPAPAPRAAQRRGTWHAPSNTQSAPLQVLNGHSSLSSGLDATGLEG